MINSVTQSSWVAVGGAALVTAIATGFGAIPLLLARRASPAWLRTGNAIAALLMVVASLMLFYQGARSGAVKTVAGAALGVVVISLSARWLRRRESWTFGDLRGLSARTAVMIVAVMTVHSCAEGIGVGVAFGDGKSIGFLTALAIAVHNIPEGLAISLVLVPRGVGVGAAAGWSVFSSLPQPLLALPAFFFVEAFGQALPVGLGFAGGAMLWMVGAQLLPDVLHLQEHGSPIAFP